MVVTFQLLQISYFHHQRLMILLIMTRYQLQNALDDYYQITRINWVVLKHQGIHLLLPFCLSNNTGLLLTLIEGTGILHQLLILILIQLDLKILINLKNLVLIQLKELLDYSSCLFVSYLQQTIAFNLYRSLTQLLYQFKFQLFDQSLFNFRLYLQMLSLKNFNQLSQYQFPWLNQFLLLCQFLLLYLIMLCLLYQLV